MDGWMDGWMDHVSASGSCYLVLSCRRYNPPLVGAPLQVGTLIKLG